MNAATRCRATATAAVLVGLTTSAPARADDRVTFAWDAPQGCPSSAAVEAAIVARLGAARVASRVDVRGSVSREAAGFRVRVSTGPNERALVAPSCAQAAEAVAVIVAVAIDEAERARATPPATSTPDNPTTVTPAEASEPARLARAEAPPAEWPTDPPASASSPFTRWIELCVGAGVDTASLPKPSPGIAVSADWRVARWLSLGVVVSAFLPQTERHAGDPAVRATVALVDAIAGACVLAPVAVGAREMDLGACLGAGAGLLPAESAAVSNPASGLGMRPELLAAGRLRLPLSGRFALRLDAGPLVDPSRPPFEVGGVGVVHRPAIATFRAIVGVGIIFW
jgi:hypothetical protein